MPFIVTQRSSISNVDTFGYDFAADHEIYRILANVAVSSENNYGVHSVFSNTTLINRGEIHSGSDSDLGSGTAAVFFAGANGTIDNAAGALIRGLEGADMFGAGTQTLNNSGRVIGLEGVVFGDTSGTPTLNNDGFIRGFDFGVVVDSHHNGGTILNSGTIKSEGGIDIGILVSIQSPTATAIVNDATGIIEAQRAIVGYSGRFSLNNAGKIIGTIVDNANLPDVVINHGIIQGRIDLGGRNDLFNGTGGTSGPVFGGLGNDRLIGGSHNDALHGGDDNDTLTGGPGADKFFFDTAVNPTSNVDQITDFTPRQGDKIVLSETYFPGLGPHGTLAAGHFHVGATVPRSPHIIYTPGNGFLYYDADGTARETFHFATLTTHPVLHNTDFMVIA